MKRIKWENIAFIIMLVYGVVAMLHHNMNAFTYTELPIYLGLALVVRYAVKYVRTNTNEFIKEIKDIFKD